jgi:DNA primase
VALEQSFLDELRARTTLSAVIGRTTPLTRAGREFKACCPFHGEKTPSFTVNDEKHFYHCFGCGAHGDAIRWLTDQQGLEFIEAVRQLAAEAGLEMPERSPEAAQRARAVEGAREAIEVAQQAFARHLAEAGGPMEYLTRRGLDPEVIERFGLGYARAGTGSLAGCGIGERVGLEAGLLAERDDGRGLRERFWDRITVPIHDARGRIVGFGGRVWPGRRTQDPKYLNSPEGPLFDKGRLLFNLHRARSAALPQAENRLVIVEGYFDVIGLASAGVEAAVAPMGTALTHEQIERCWRLHHRPVLLFDGDPAGCKAALRACETALPLVGPGCELAVAILPPGKDPDDVARGAGGAREIAAVLAEARALHEFVFDEIAAAAGDAPEALAGVWERLAELAGAIAHEDTRAEYLGLWRARFDREISSLGEIAPSEPLHALRRAEDGDYAFPESESDSAQRLIQIVRHVLAKRAERREITEEIADALKMAEAVGFVKKEIQAVVRDIESDLANGPVVREEAEMARVLYRRVLGIRGPMTEAMLPSVIDARPRLASAAAKRRATQDALIEAGGLQV